MKMKIVSYKLGSLLGGLVLLGIATATPAFADTDLQVISAFLSRSEHGVEVATSPSIGDPCRLTVRYRVVGDTATPFKIRFRMAAEGFDLPAPRLQPGEGTLTGRFDPPLDGMIPFSVFLDPQHTAGELNVDYGNNRTSGAFTPLSPSQAIEFYEPRTLIGTQQAHVDFAEAGTLSRFILMMGQPHRAGSQTLLDSLCTVDSALGFEVVAPTPGNAVSAPVFVWDRKHVPAQEIEMIHTFRVEARNIRADADALRQVTWAQLDAISASPYFHYYKQPEAVVESQSPGISEFVLRVLGEDYRARHTPYDAARTLFRAIVKGMTYAYPSPPRTAVQALTVGKGGPEAFSLVTVAVLRNIGFPARTVGGMREGWEEGRTWSECYFPGKGWLVHDAAASKGWDPAGNYGYCFGAIRDLNRRVAWSQGNTYPTAVGTATGLQMPWYRYWGTAPASFTTNASIMTVN